MQNISFVSLQFLLLYNIRKLGPNLGWSHEDQYLLYQAEMGFICMINDLHNITLLL